MEAQEIFYVIASVALVVIIGFIVFAFFVVYHINRMARTGFQALNFAARDIQNSFGAMAKGWGRATLFGLVIKAIRAYFRR